MRRELKDLVHDTRLFIQGPLRMPASINKERPQNLQSVVKSIPVPSVEVIVEEVKKEVNAPPPIELPKKVTVSKEIKRGDWELQPMIQREDSLTMRKKLSNYTETCDPPIAVILILPEENTVHRLFLENVCRAITRTFASASVELYFEGIFQKRECSLFLAPLTLLKKKSLQAHTLFKEQEQKVIPLENLDVYAHDVNSKRALWTAIQQSFQ